ncbi:MAG: hypothetical protein DMG72_01655 [Acidobacteria bacterium]|nr:MAG: hypothetical protein DMG72_01655 [Acidobacteriota bacterium]
MRRNISAFADHFVLVVLVLSISIPGGQANLQGQWSTLPYLVSVLSVSANRKAPTGAYPLTIYGNQRRPGPLS